MKTYAIDFESYYEAGYGIEEMGVHGYLHDKRFDAYLVSIVGEGTRMVAHPKDIPWNLLDNDLCFVAHNASFDRRVFERCQELGTIPDYVKPKHWYCTANLSVFLAGPRSLKDASKYLLGREMSKEMRNYMKGKTWDQAVAESKDVQLMQYALDDSINCYDIWVQYSDQWPEAERKCAEITHIQTVRGIAVDTALLDECLPKVLTARDEALGRIPWAGTEVKGTEVKPLSALALKAWCKDNEIEVPTTTEAKSPEFMKWQEEHKDVDVVKAMQTYRSANALAMKGQLLRRQVNDQGRYNFGMKYFGATTGRWSAGYEDERNDSSGFNIQNIIKEEMYGLNLRKALIAGPGKKFVVSDYSQIEPRCLAWLCDDKPFLKALFAVNEKGERTGLYEAYARAQGSWSGDKVLKKVDPKMYAQKKAEVLALGYGAGWAKFIFMCKMYGAEDCLLEPLEPTDQERFLRYIHKTSQQDKLIDIKTDTDWMKAVNAWKIVLDYRSNNPRVAGRAGIWKQLEADCRKCVGTNYEVELPSGRKLTYFNVRLAGGLTAQKTMHDIPIKIWGGFLTENVTQATARDVMRDAIIRLEDAGVETLFTVHDEIVCEVDKDFDPKIIKDIMNVTPEWMPGLPLEIEQEETTYYKK